MYEQVIRPALDVVGHSEQMHHWVRDSLGIAQHVPGGLKVVEQLALGGERFKSPRLENSFGGLKRENTKQVGAGWDKYGHAQRTRHLLGDGATVIGGITPNEQPVNQNVIRQVVVRNSDGKYASVNNYGLGNDGAEKTAQTLMQYLDRDWPIIISAAFMKSAQDLKDMPKDYAEVVRTMFPIVDGQRIKLVDGVQVLVSCPNTHGPDFVHRLHDRSFLIDTVKSVRGAMLETIGFILPTDIKVGGDATLNELLTVMRVCSDYGFGMVGINTSGNKAFKDHFGIGHIAGGFSGDYPPYRSRANEAAALIFNESGGKVHFVGAGGNYTGADAWERHLAGAYIIEDVFGHRINGPATSNEMNKYIDAQLVTEGISHISEVIGRDAKKYEKDGYPNIPRD